MILIVDRIENETAVCENPCGKISDIPLYMLPEGISEGDVIRIEIDNDERKSRIDRIKKMMENLKAK